MAPVRPGRALLASPPLRGVDVLVILGLLRRRPGDWTVRTLAAELHLPLASVQRSLQRLGRTPAFDRERREARISGCEELFTHALRFACPAELGGRTRGMATAWTVARLTRRLRAPADAPQPVWPHPRGKVRGAALRPLHAAVPGLAAEDPEMHELLALTDAARMAPALPRPAERAAGRAAALLRAWIASSPAAASGAAGATARG